MSGAAPTAGALAALFQLPGAPSFTLIRTDGATSLDEVDGEYVMLGSNGFGPWLDMNNSPVTAGQFGAWTPIGAAELPAGGYEIAWKNATTGLYTVWYANAYGDYFSSLTGGAVSGIESRAGGSGVELRPGPQRRRCDRSAPLPHHANPDGWLDHLDSTLPASMSSR